MSIFKSSSNLTSSDIENISIKEISDIYDFLTDEMTHSVEEYMIEYDKILQITNNLSEEFLATLRNVASTSSATLFSLGTGVLENAYSLIKQGNLQEGAELLRKNKTNLLGDFGETYGLLKMKQFVEEILVKDLRKTYGKNAEFKVSYKNTGQDFIEGQLTNRQRRVGDTEISINISKKGKNIDDLTFSVSHKMKKSYLRDPSKIKTLGSVKLRTTTINQVANILELQGRTDMLDALYESYSLHYIPVGSKHNYKKTRELFVNSRQTLEMRRTIGKLVMAQYLQGIAGENVAFISMGGIIVPMQELQRYWSIPGTPGPYMSNISETEIRRTLESLIGDKTKTEEDAIQKINKMSVNIIANIHLKNLTNAIRI